jgi:hypothetical protein
MKKPAIPPTPSLDNAGLRTTIENMRINVEAITGRRGIPVKSLAGSASTGDIVAKINELILLLQE